MDNGCPGPSTLIPSPSWSKTVSPPKFEKVPQPPDSYQRISRAFTTNQPSPLHTRPCSVTSTGASGTFTRPTIDAEIPGCPQLVVGVNPRGPRTEQPLVSASGLLGQRERNTRRSTLPYSSSPSR